MGPGGRPQFEPLPELTVAAATPTAHPRPAIYNLSVSRGFSAKDWFGEYLPMGVVRVGWYGLWWDVVMNRGMGVL